MMLGFAPLRKEQSLGLRSSLRVPETISAINESTQQKTSSTTEPKWKAPFKIVIVESERFKFRLACCGDISLWVKKEHALKRKKSALNRKRQTEQNVTQSERCFSGQFRTAPAPPAEPGLDAWTEKTAHDQGGGW